MRTLVWLAALFGALIFSGCFAKKARFVEPPGSSGTVAASVSTNTSAAKPTLIVTPDNGLSGRVTSFNPNLRFVVLTFPVGQMPAIDQRLSVYRGGLKVGEVKVTGPQQDDNIVADIVAGDSAKGDEVRDK